MGRPFCFGGMGGRGFGPGGFGFWDRRGLGPGGFGFGIGGA
jgi:hypothetical protein